MRAALAILVVALGLAPALQGCAGRPAASLIAVAPAVPPNPTVELLAVTTRRPSEDDALLFSGERTSQPRYARIAISIPRERKIGEVEWPASGGKPDPATTFAAVGVERLQPEGFPAALHAAARGPARGHVLVFVHGYNTRFDEAAFRLAQIVHDSGAPVTPILFSWPSWGSLAAYPYDRESAAFSRDALEDVLARLARDPSVTQISVLAHSMGGWLTMEALRQMAIRQGRVPPRIASVMLAAPDIDVDVALMQGRALGRQRPRMTLFVSADDGALNVSRRVWGSRDRLGAIDPTREPYRTNLAAAGVEVIDLTAERTEDRLAHSKFAESPLAVRLIGARLAGGQKLDGRIGIEDVANSVTEGATRAAGDILTAPLRLVQPSEPAPAASRRE
jgi:esterase/lipase superfamily enzyme